MANTANVFQGASTVIPVVNTNGNIFEEWQIATAAQAVFTLLTFQYTINTKSIFVFKLRVFLKVYFCFRLSIDYENKFIFDSRSSILLEFYFWVQIE